MKKIKRLNDVRPIDAEQEDWFWDRVLYEDDQVCHARKTDCPTLKSKRRIRKIQNRTIKSIQENDSIED